MHHNFDDRKTFNKYVGPEKLGATGQFPNGRYDPNDEGEIQFAVAADTTKGVVLIDFGKPVHTLGMTPEQARELADTLTAKAFEARGITS